MRVYEVHPMIKKDDAKLILSGQQNSVGTSGCKLYDFRSNSLSCSVFSKSMVETSDEIYYIINNSYLNIITFSFSH